MRDLKRIIKAFDPLEVVIDGNGLGVSMLDFIAQEMNREANTILSKANDLETSNIGIELKTEIEKVREQTQKKFEDDYLVAKVEKLEAAVRELTEDDEDEKSKFSVEELAIILDMDVEEIRDVLRLTGDDK